MRYRILSIFLLLYLCLIQACTTGVHANMKSTSPEHSIVFLGMKRSEAERHLGLPLFVTRIDEDQYKGIYEYEAELGPKDVKKYDLLDIATLGFGKSIVSPIDRARGGHHLMAVTYQIEAVNTGDDIVIDIKDRVRLVNK